MTRPGAGRSRVAATERRILDAARELFVELGYSDTTLSAVARRAGVGARTVYLRFGSKGSVLLRAADLALDGATSLEAPDAGSDPAVAYAQRVRDRFERLGGLVRVLVQAGATEPFVADAMNDARTANRRAAAALVGVGRPGAAETVAVLSSAETWLELTEAAGWDPGTYQSWLVATIGAVTSR